MNTTKPSKSATTGAGTSTNGESNSVASAATVSSKKPGIANAVPLPKKNPFLFRWSLFYSTRIPLGIREFVFLGPLLLVTFGVAYYIPALVPIEKFTRGLTPNTTPMVEYSLEPMYDAHGTLKGYRRIARRSGEVADMRLTLEMIRRAPQFTNTLRQREIDLRGLGLTVLDEQSLLLLNDSFDVLNLSQNPLVRLEYFPGCSSSIVASGTVEAVKMMLRLQSLIVHRNRLSHVSESTCAGVLPNLRAFLADHNEFRELRDLLFLSHWRKLEILSIEHNPVTVQEDDARLRAFLVYLCPKLKLINYQRVTQVDRGNVESMRSEFGKLVNEWRNPGKQGHAEITNNNTHGANGATTEGAGSGLVNEKKRRKRGREARVAASSYHSITADSSSITSGAMPAAAAAAHTTHGATLNVGNGDGIYDDVDATQARLEALEAKMAAAETEEELLEVQQEIAELEAATRRQQERATKSKCTRTA